MKLFQFFTNAVTKPAVSSRVVGIDIGSSAIKVVELQDRDGVITLMSYGELQLGPYMEKVIGQSVQLTPPIERQALVDVLRESAVKAKEAVLAIPLSSSFITVMTLDASAKDDLTSRVRVEARKYIPVPIADVTLDWAEVYVTEDAKQTTRDILLAAIQNDALKRFSTLLGTVEFNKAPTEIECFSTIRSSYDTEQEGLAVIDIGASTTKLYIVRSGVLQQMYRLPGGGEMVTNKMMQEFNLTFGEAESLKRQITRDHEQFPAVQKIYQTVLERTLKEFRQVIEKCEGRSGIVVSSLALTGGASLFPGVDNYISHELSRSVRYVTPFEKVAYPAFMEDTLRAISPTFATALGSALRSFE